jgi:hypothetical protein
MLDKVNKKKSKSDEPKEDIIDEGDTQDAIKSASTGVSDLSKQIDDDVISKLKEDESSMKNKLKNRFDVSDEEINDFLETHQKDIDGGADPEEEFMNYAMVNNIPHK